MRATATVDVLFDCILFGIIYPAFQCSDQAAVGKGFLALTYAECASAHLDLNGLLDFLPPY